MVKSICLVETGIQTEVEHKFMTRRGPSKKIVIHKECTFQDFGKYTGEVLREIRKTSHNAKGDLRR